MQKKKNIIEEWKFTFYIYHRKKKLVTQHIFIVIKQIVDLFKHINLKVNVTI